MHIAGDTKWVCDVGAVPHLHQLVQAVVLVDVSRLARHVIVLHVGAVVCVITSTGDPVLTEQWR